LRSRFAARLAAGGDNTLVAKVDTFEARAVTGIGSCESVSAPLTDWLGNLV
jgi:hypothetical protein